MGNAGFGALVCSLWQHWHTWNLRRLVFNFLRLLPSLSLNRAVQHMALRRMAAAFRSWRYLTAYRAHARAVVEQSVVRLSQRTLATAWHGWQQAVAERRVARHRIAVCQRRQQLALVKGAFASWREAAALQGAERQLVQLCQRRADRNRCVLSD